MGQDPRGRLPPPLPRGPLEEEQTDAVPTRLMGATRGHPTILGRQSKAPRREARRD